MSDTNTDTPTNDNKETQARVSIGTAPKELLKSLAHLANLVSPHGEHVHKDDLELMAEVMIPPELQSEWYWITDHLNKLNKKDDDLTGKELAWRMRQIRLLQFISVMRGENTAGVIQYMRCDKISTSYRHGDFNELQVQIYVADRDEHGNIIRQEQDSTDS